MMEQFKDVNRRKSKHKEKLNIAMFGQKRIPSREGGVEIVVEELCSRMVAQGHNVTCYDRGGHHVSGSEYDSKRLKEYKGIRLKTVPTIEMESAVALYDSEMSLQAIGEELRLNQIKVRKLLITAGVYESEVAKKVQDTFEEYRETQD